MTPDLHLTTPLIALAIAALVTLLMSAWRVPATAIGGATGLGLLGLAAHMTLNPAVGPAFLAAGAPLLQFSAYTNLAQVILLVLAAISILLVRPALAANKSNRGEFYVLLILSLCGMFTLTSATNLLTFYLGLELMSFPLYIMCAFYRNDSKSSEAALKYFVLGGLVSGLLLFGVSLVYAASGALSFAALHQAVGQGFTPLMATGLALIILAVMFKLSTVPFHMWTPDVYEGSPTPTTTIMAALPKLAAFIFLVRLLNGPLSGLTDLWQPALALLAILSMLAGAMVAIIQTNLKRLLAWSTIANVGFILTGVVAANVNGHAGVLFYLATYGVMQIGLFAIAQELELRQITTIPQLAGFAARNPRIATTLLVLLFSLAGVPPFVGFFAKIGVFGAAVAAGFGPLVVVGVAASVVAAFYSLWLIKLMYFDAPSQTAPTSEEASWMSPLAMVSLLAAISALVLGILPSLLANFTLPAATALF